MRPKKYIWLKLSAIVATLVFLFPTAMQVAHSLEGHHHEECHEVSTHIHAKKLDCNINDFHFSSFTFELAIYSESRLNVSISTPTILYFSSEKDTPHFHYTLRGPPIYT
ncbi:hypothetical protein [Ulvibacter antarcticus]|uniref:DUF2607 family protein n=1 Tax=Ulvibacter antarcticus TaxID=442714 RepID=A0A3L9YXE9_9FLAO|nr:hypothetical protein [Ulvibacter antarcticus]RMA64500.1 hypothetical protein BXY75_1376 [Ulvibacter antarcticus]